MKLKSIYTFLFFCCISCSNHYNKKLLATDIIPNNHKTIIKINNIDDFKNNLSRNKLVKHLYADSLIRLTKLIKTTNPIYLSYSKNSSSLVTKFTDSLFTVDSTLTTKSKYISKTVINTDTIYHRTVDGLFFASKSFELINTLNKEPNTQLEEFFATTNKDAAASVLFKNQKESSILLNTNKSDSLKYEVIDIETDAKSLIFNGVSKSADTSFTLNAFKNTIPQPFNLAKIIPDDVISVKRIAFDDYSIFSNNISKFNTGIKDSLQTLLNLSNEIALIKLKSGKSIAINFLDNEVINTEVNQNSISETYKDVEIFNFSNPAFFNQRLQPFIKLKKASYGFIMENFVVFSSDVPALKNIISKKLNNSVLSQTEKFQNINTQLASSSSYIIYKNEDGLTEYLGNNAKGYNTNLVQYIYDTNFAHINGVFSKFKKGNKNSITEDFSVKIPNEILTKPHTLKNHLTGGHDIIVQDVTNTLYQISNSGKILWKKKLDGPILGKTEQIDIYKNGRLQLVFATKNKVYVIDRKGRDVTPFPMKFKDDITQPLSVFDYDSRKNYRLLVTQNNQLLMYDNKGKRIKGFDYKKADHKITSQPKHFRINSKDYIVFSQGKKLEILNRQGKERIKINDEIEFSDSEIFNYRNQFITKTKKGKLLNVDTKGNLKYSNTNLTVESKITTTNKTMVSLTENKLKINTKEVNLDYGNYTEPQIFYLNNKLFISITDLQTKKVFVYNSEAQLLDNFPIYGTSSAILQKLEKNRTISLITQSDNQSIVVYKIN